jgi:hypothetical protein
VHECVLYNLVVVFRCKYLKLLHVSDHDYSLISLFKEDKKLATIWNVFAIIKGYEEPDRYVILGNHRDAWTYGAVDPNSGTAALLNIARRLGIMLQSGWTPRRTIILCSWDAEEFGMVSRCERKMILLFKHLLYNSNLA